MIDLKPLPMEEARQFWAGKVPLSPGQFARLRSEAKVRAFAVSGIARGDELDSVFQALQRAIDQGTDFARFKEDIGEILDRRGWTGPRAWRVDNIFRTNIQTAYSVGRYKQMKEVAESRPYWQYSAVNDSRTRPTHAAMDGKVFRHDHPFWDTWYPPNGFRCRCGVTTLSAEEVAERGLQVEQADPTGKLVEPKDPDTGRKLPARLLMPDPGFKHHPGKEIWEPLGQALTERLDKWPLPLAAAVVKDEVQGPAFKAWLEAPAGNFPMGVLDREAAVLLGVDSRAVVLTAANARALGGSPVKFAQVQRIIEQGARRIDDGDLAITLDGVDVHLRAEEGLAEIVSMTKEQR